MKSQNLKAWINYLNSLNLSAKNIDLVGLDRIRTVAKKLNLLKPNIPVITVAGTNGKGSTVALLESILVKAGYHVGCYTTPFLISFNEQFRINQNNISNNNLCEYFNLIKKTRDELQVKLTLFEFKFLASLLFFKNNKLDILVLEVGLGGEHDAVNIIDPSIAVITSIGLDHLDWFGNDINNIARAKSGIFRKNQKAVYGDINPPRAIFDRAEALGTKVFYAQQDFEFQLSEEEKNKNYFSWLYTSKNKKLEKIPKPKLLINNASTALMVIELLQEIMPVSKRAIYDGIEQAFVLGRQQVIQESPLIIADVAHNQDSVVTLKNFLLSQVTQQIKNQKIIAVFSAINTKELDHIIGPMSELISEWHIASLDTPRSYKISEIKAVIHQVNQDDKNHLNISIYSYENIKTAYQSAQANLSQQDCLVAFGSFLVVEQVILLTAGRSR